MVLTPDSGVTPCRNPWFVRPGLWFPLHLYGVRIDRLGTNIAAKFARRYYNEVVTAVHPYNIEHKGADATADWYADGALIVSDPMDADGVAPEVLAPIDEAIAYAAATMTLKTGDLILLPDPVDITVPALTEGENYIYVALFARFPDITVKVR